MSESLSMAASSNGTGVESLSIAASSNGADVQSLSIVASSNGTDIESLSIATSSNGTDAASQTRATESTRKRTWNQVKRFLRGAWSLATAARCAECKRICAWAYQCHVQEPDHPQSWQAVKFQRESLSALQASAFKGCDLCRLLRAAVLTQSPKELHENPAQRFEVRGVRSSLQLMREHRVIGNLTILERDGPDHGGNLSGIAAFSPRTHKRDFKRTIDLMKRWDSRCTSQHLHQLNSRIANTAFLPTRLIDVTAVGKHRGLKLYCPPARTRPGQRNQYTILSYCWGKTVSSTKTTLQNLSQRTVGFDMAELPKTIEDAINITHKLGIRFIWIDAVCIIQDEPGHADFLRESVRMSDYYGNAYLTIVAASSSNSEGGCAVLRSIGLTPLEDCEIGGLNGDAFAPIATLFSSKQSHTKKGRTRLRICPSRSKLSYRYDQCIDNSIWATRGWTFQERLLSNRVVFWTDFGLWWDCGDIVSSEYDTEDHEIEVDRFRPHRLHLISTEKLTGYLWYEQLSKFSKCNFTVATDRLVALSGLAKRVQKSLDRRTGSTLGSWAPLSMREKPLSTPITYLGGMWSNNITMNLAWASEAESCNRRHQDYVGPSWSFLSIDGPVSWLVSEDVLYRLWEEAPPTSLADLLASPKTEHEQGSAERTAVKCVLEILDHKLVYQNDSFGPLKPGCTLTVRGVLAPITLNTKDLIRSRHDNFELWDRFIPAFVSDDTSLEISGPVFALVMTWDHRGYLFSIVVTPTHRRPREYMRLGMCIQPFGSEPREEEDLFDLDSQSEPAVIDLV